MDRLPPYVPNMQAYFAPSITAVSCLLVTWLLLRKAPRGVAVAVCLLTAVAVWIAVAAWQSFWQPISATQAGVDLPVREPPVIELAQLHPVRPVQVAESGYVSSQDCGDCHAHNHATWFASYHRRMTQIASPEAVIGDFNDVRVTAQGRVYHLRRRQDVCWVEMDNPDAPIGQGPRVDVPIVLTTGSHHMQVYWYPTGHSRMVGQLPLVFLRETQQWIPRDAAFLVAPGGFESETGRWNETCIQCHTTHGRPRPDARGSWDSQVGEFGIACEACHGPGQRHIELRASSEFFEEEDDPMVNPDHLSHRLASHVCGQCHSVNVPRNMAEFLSAQQHGKQFRPGQDLHETRWIVREDAASRAHLEKKFTDVDAFIDGQFWADGMIRISGREYNGLIESACFQQGTLSCLTCHRMHKSELDPRPMEEWADDQLHPDMRGDTACLECHDANRYGAQHTHHPPNSTGARCYNCHMPYTTYGLLKAIRSHEIGVPDLSADWQVGRPNACNQCHLDQTLEWTAQNLNDWYGAEIPSFGEDEKTVAASLLWLLRGDAGQRALAAWSMGWQPALEASGSQWQAPFLARLLDDPYAAVRFIAHRSLQKLPGFADFAYDFVGPVGERHAAGEQARRIWESEDRAGPPIGTQLLIDPETGLPTDAVHRLLEQRDNRPVNLAE